MDGRQYNLIHSLLLAIGTDFYDWEKTKLKFPIPFDRNIAKRVK